jgi:HTH-type transcriptional regulator / antitoxin HigA
VQFAFLVRLPDNLEMALTDTYKTPGQYIQALLDKHGWNQRILAIVLGADETGVNKIVTAKRSVNAEMALALGDLFQVPPEDFLELQQSYDLAKARITAQPNPGRTNRAHLFGGLPISDMIKRGWLNAEDVRDVPKVEAALMKFFGAQSLEEIEILPHAAKRTEISTEATPAQLAWLYRVKAIAADMMVAKYSPEAVREAVHKLSALRHAPEESRKVPRILMECGIRFVIVESLPSAKIDGVCFWLNNQQPVIGMSLRHDRIDNFWFVLRHELEHVLQLHGQKQVMLDAELEGERAGVGSDIDNEERVANRAAAEFCVPSTMMRDFVTRKAPFFAERDVLGFANTLGVHPGLVAGQLQHLTAKYDRFRNHLVKIRSAVTPGAMVDGWGDVAPVDI